MVNACVRANQAEYTLKSLVRIQRTFIVPFKVWNTQFGVWNVSVLLINLMVSCSPSIAENGDIVENLEFVFLLAKLGMI